MHLVHTDFILVVDIFLFGLFLFLLITLFSTPKRVPVKYVYLSHNSKRLPVVDAWSVYK